MDFTGSYTLKGCLWSPRLRLLLLTLADCLIYTLPNILLKSQEENPRLLLLFRPQQFKESFLASWA
eukprot:scaffold190833_cov17-Tisochrysis_lutea.AAC.1